MEWLYSDDWLAVGQRDRAFDGSTMVLVHVNAAFRIQDLIQAFSRARLRRRAVLRRRQGARSYGEKDHDDTERDRPHEHIIHAALVAGCRQSLPAVISDFAEALRADRSCCSQAQRTEEYASPASIIRTMGEPSRE